MLFQFESFLLQPFLYGLYVLVVACFELHLQLTRVDVLAVNAALVVYAEHVGAERGQHFDYFKQLSGLVGKLH